MPPNVLTHLRFQSSASHTQHLAEVKTTISHANSIVRLSMAHQLDQPSPANAQAIAKILQLPK